MCQSEHLVQHRGLIHTSKWRQQTAYHCASHVFLLCPTADSALASLASEKIYTEGEDCTKPSTPTLVPPQLRQQKKQLSQIFTPSDISEWDCLTPKAFPARNEGTMSLQITNQNLPVFSEGIMQLFFQAAPYAVIPACISKRTNTWDLSLPFVELHEFPDSSFLQPIEVSLLSSTQIINHSPAPV